MGMNANMTMCIQVRRKTEDEKGGYELTTGECVSSSGLNFHPFKFLRKDGDLFKTIKSSLQVESQSSRAGRPNKADSSWFGGWLDGLGGIAHMPEESEKEIEEF